MKTPLAALLVILLPYLSNSAGAAEIDHVIIAYQILRKRPERMAEITASLPCLGNVWLGTSVEDCAVLNRLEFLRATPAAIRFVPRAPQAMPFL